jgi:hypothetical protein
MASRLRWNSRRRRRTPMDAIFILLTLILYATTHWLVRALGKLGGIE